MKKLFLLPLLLIAMMGAASAQVQVRADAGVNGTTVHISAAATTTAKSITAWHIYADTKDVYANKADVATIATNLTLPVGKHSLIVKAWDIKGATGSATLSVTVSSTPPPPPPPSGPVPPANATAIANVQSLDNWQSCDTPVCSGSKAGASGSWWYALNNTTPSLTGASAEFHADGTAGENVLWHRGMPIIAGDTRAHFIYDYWVYMPAGSTNHVWSFEHDILGMYNGRKYNFSTQCHITSYINHAAHWDTYDGYNHHWIHTPISCAALIDTGKWHHIQIAGERTSDLRNHYLSFTTDGVTATVPTAYAWFATLPSNWANHWTLQVQINLMTGNSGSSEYYDKSTLFVF